MTDPVLTTSGAVLLKAGKNVSNDVSGATVVQFINDAEGYVNAVSGVQWTEIIGTVNSGGVFLLNQIVSSLAAIDAVAYDPSGYTSRVEAEDIINVLAYKAELGINQLREGGTTKFLKTA